MRTHIWRVCALVVILAVAGCAGHRAKKNEPEMPLPPGVSEAPSGLKFSVKITPSRFQMGQHVKLEATMFNDSQKRYERDSQTSCVWDYEIARDSRIVGPKRTCTPIDSTFTLEPGELRMILREWGGNDHYFGASLTPGTYQVTAGLIENERVVPMADPVTVEILP